MGFESVIRPFETMRRFNSARIPAKTADPKGGAAHLCWGDVGTKPTPMPNGISVEMNDCSETNKELQGRKSQDIRIENPNDADQYVMVRRPTTMSFKHTDAKKSTWNEMSLVAASVTEWEADLEADLGINNDEGKCKMQMTLKPPGEDATE